MNGIKELFLSTVVAMSVGFGVDQPDHHDPHITTDNREPVMRKYYSVGQDTGLANIFRYDFRFKQSYVYYSDQMGNHYIGIYQFDEKEDDRIDFYKMENGGEHKEFEFIATLPVEKAVENSRLNHLYIPHG